MPKKPAGFHFTMTKNQLVLGLIWLPVHFFVLPVLLPLMTLLYPGGMEETTVNVVFQGLSFTFLMVVMFGYLKNEFFTLLERKIRSLLTVAGGWMMNLVLAMAVVWLMEFLVPELLALNPNQETMQELGEMGKGALFAVAVCLAPIVEETLFRGCLFGAIRRRHRALAYAVSALAFSLLHVWQYAVVYLDLSQLLYIVQYLPVSIALAWCYERSGSLWTSIFLHMFINAIALSLF